MENILNYIYDEKGSPEYVVIPIKLWNSVKKLINFNGDKNNSINENFNPEEYYGLTSGLNLNIEEELKNIREEWTRDF